MATLEALSLALKQQIPDKAFTKALTDAEYQDGFNLFLHHNGWANYRDFVIPKLSQILDSQLQFHKDVSVLEVGPGPKSVLQFLPSPIRQKIANYTAFEPNHLFARQLQDWLKSTHGTSRFPSLGISYVHMEPFTKDTIVAEKYHIILFCHSLYGLTSKEQVIIHALDMLFEEPDEGMVLVCHRDRSLRLNGLVCQQSALLPDGIVCIKDSDDTINKFATFITGCSARNSEVQGALDSEWRKTCRALARRETNRPDTLAFASPEIMVTFTRHATELPELTALVPTAPEHYKVKNREAQSQTPAAVVRPTEIGQVQNCVSWALKHRVGLTVVGGGHSGHCRWPNVVSVDMSAFDKVHIVQNHGESSDVRALVVAGAGCKTGDIIQSTKSEGLTLPLGARPSVGSGMWLQGGIGHLTRIHGLTCDAIVGAVLVSVESGQVLCVGNVPDEHQPIDAVRPRNEEDLLWSLKGAGTNFAIVISVVFKAYSARSFSVKDWCIPLRDGDHAKFMLQKFARTLAPNLCRDSSVDAYLYHVDDQLVLGVTLFQSRSTEPDKGSFSTTPESFLQVLGGNYDTKMVDAVGLFDTEMYISRMHGGHGGGKTSAFKRCVFLKDIDQTEILSMLLTAVGSRPSPLCYFHLLHGGWPVAEVASDATALGCRHWDFACVVTGVWPRDDDDTPTARATIQWVYSVVEALLPVSQGVYGADLGPDPRDTGLATKAFGPNLRRLVSLKQAFDPHRVLAYACPLSQDMLPQKVVILVTGEHGVGKDHCAKAWSSTIERYGHSSSVISISDSTKREYASHTGANLSLILKDRVYKERHRDALTAFFQQQLKRRPHLAEEHFVEAVRSADVDFLFITGMRDEAPVATLSHLIPDVRLIDVHVEASQKTRTLRRQNFTNSEFVNDPDTNGSSSNYRPSLIFDNDTTDDHQVKAFAKNNLLPFLSDSLRRLASMVRSTTDFPKPGIKFRHVLDISQQKGGLSLCTSLLKKHLAGGWSDIDAIVSCEAGGPIFAAALAQDIDVRFVLIRKAGKLPPPTISVQKCSSYISSHVNDMTDDRIEMDANAFRKGARVVIIDDVLATGSTLLSTLEILFEADVDIEDISIMVVAEFPLHCGREALRKGGFGRVGIQSLLVFDGM